MNWGGIGFCLSMLLLVALAIFNERRVIAKGKNNAKRNGDT
jgi:hypothetical protein